MKLFKRLLCKIFGHKGWISQRGKPIRCKRCGALWALSD